MEWISTKNRLPENDDDVLVYSEKDGINIGNYIHDERYGRWRVYTQYPDRPTHWIPLPEPPEE